MPGGRDERESVGVVFLLVRLPHQTDTFTQKSGEIKLVTRKQEPFLKGHYFIESGSSKSLGGFFRP